MGNKTRVIGKSKQIIIAVISILVIATIAVISALVFTWGKDDSGENQGNEYSIVVSCGIDGVSDYSLTVKEGTKIRELKGMLRELDGYKIDGIYKDDAMTQPYSDNETINNSTKIYIKFVKAYRINFANEEFKTGISVRVDGEPVDQNTTFVYGANVIIRATQKAGREIVEFKVKVGNGEAQDILSEVYRHEANGVIYYEVELTGDGDIIIEYRESLKQYVFENIPAGVTVKREGELLSNSSAIFYGDKLTFTYVESTKNDTGKTKQENGYHYTEVETIIYSLVVNGTNLASGKTYVVSGNVGMVLNINSSTAWEKGEMVQYDLGTIPDGVTVTRHGETLNSDSVIYWGDELTFAYTETSVVLTGNTKFESGYKWAEKATTTYSLSVGEKTIANGGKFTVNGNVELLLSSTTSTNWKESYALVSFADASWSEINEVAEADYASEAYKVGDKKDITLTDGEVLTFVILGFNHDDLTSGGKAKISIGMENLTETKFKMNSTLTNVGGWESCEIRTMLSDYFDKLPDELQEMIKEVNKNTNEGGQSKNIVTTSDKLWLFSPAEIFSPTAIKTGWSLLRDHATYYTQEGTQYEFYRNLVGDEDPNNKIESLIKKLSNGNGEASMWWLRSPSISTKLSIICIEAGGKLNGYNATFENGICFGFCL